MPKVLWKDVLHNAGAKQKSNVIFGPESNIYEISKVAKSDENLTWLRMESDRSHM